MENTDKPRIIVGAATCGRASGALHVLDRVKAELERHQLDAIIMQTGCIGLCYAEPLLDIVKPGRPRICYSNVTPEIAAHLIEDYLIKDNPQPDLALGSMGEGSVAGISNFFELPMLKPQVRIILRNCGFIDPEKLDHYIARGGYGGLVKTLKMTPEGVIQEIKKSGLRGRGGAGFPTGTKWELCRQSPGKIKYIVCNADEGDPGAFMNRSLIEGDPHSVLEGMLIGAYAIGATEGYVYIRAEYPLAIERLKLALQQATEYGFIGDNILGSGFSFHIKIKEGAGAFVCGEETALMASIEGKRGMPRPRPPFPAQAGLWGKPTNINNTETWAAVAAILHNSAEWFACYGSARSKGTKTFSLVGKVNKPQLIEVPIGITLKEIIYDIGDGVAGGKRLKGVQTGGPSGGCIPASRLDLSVDYESLTEAGSIMGSGGMVVLDEDTCMVDFARYFISFTQSESCGKCVMCRLGTKQIMDTLGKIARGQGTPEDIALLEDLGKQVKIGSLCGLGQTAPNPVLSSLRYFRNEYEEHIKKHHCAAAVCSGLVRAPCSHTCPAGIDVPRYIRFIEAGKPDESVAVIREKIPFPSVCGYVCVHPCETKCRRGQLDEAVGIRMLKRFAAEFGNGLWKQGVKAAPPTGKQVAVVGSGPAGLTAAYYLARLGHSVTVFEALPEPGGMMKVGIPDYRLPKDMLGAEIAEIENAGVKIKTNTRIENPESLLAQGYQAVFLAVGAHRGLKLGIPGEDSPQVIDCVSFLREVNLGHTVAVGDKVAVIGGGNAAIDAARTALRLGAAEVTMIYRRTRAEMPASDEEIEDALAEGVQVLFLSAPTKIAQQGKQVQLECVHMALGDVDTSGRRRPVAVKGSEFSLVFDTVIAAIGQQPEVPGELTTGGGNTIKVDLDTLATGKAGIFAGGDAVTGPASVIEAIAAGRQAAISIDKSLGGKGEIDEKLAPPEGELKPLEEAGEKRRPVMPVLPLGQRLCSFATVELGLTAELAAEEARRCLRCDLEEHE
ncbi:MAG: NADH-quinone oxidoreductase subunit NuoF [Chloroflexi bacterium]|nr:NADH-quinone oxidoreductase subunit NuoF [Chloroflexota bacterium]